MKITSSVLLVILTFLGSYAQTGTNNAKTNYRYKMEDGQLKVEKTYFNLGSINNSEKKTAKTKIYNTTNKTIVMEFLNVPKFIKVKSNPQEIAPNAVSELVFEYDASANLNKEGKQNWGTQSSRISMVVNGNKNESRNFFTLRANIQEDFSNYTEEQLAKAPKVVFKQKTYDFGKAQEGDKVIHEFTFTNTGKNDLEIRHVKGSCGCTAVSNADDIVKQGESSVIKATFNTKGRKGHQTKSITVTTNDPKNPLIRLMLSGDVEAKDN